LGLRFDNYSTLKEKITMEPTIKVTLKLGEPIAVEVTGVQGSGCKSLTQPLLQMGKVERLTEKPEYYTQMTAPTITITPSL
jgi:Protein of unknown function (DUF2997)